MSENSNKENESAAQIEKEIDEDKHKLRRRIIYLIILLLLLMLLLVRCMGGCDENNLIANPDYTSSDKVTKGALTNEPKEKPKTDYYNIKLNITPRLENSKLNLRIENSALNTNFIQIEVYLQKYKSIAEMASKMYTSVDNSNYEVLTDEDTHTYRLKAISEIQGYTQVSIEDDTQLIYTSPLIKPDEALEYCTIDSLPSGRYYGYVLYKAFNSSGEKEVSKTSIDIDIYAK